MKEQHKDFERLRVVEPELVTAEKRGKALVFGPFPPLTSKSSDHASVTLHQLKSVGYDIVSATGPGLALAAHHVNFSSAGKFEASCAFLNACKDAEHAVLYTRSLEFSRISKPRWYQRRLEELRRIKFVMRAIGQAKRVSLVLEKSPWQARDQFCFWGIAQLWSALRGKALDIQRVTVSPTSLTFALTGRNLPTPENFQAEASVYTAAFDGNGDAESVRLSCMRSQQCAQHWASKSDPEHSRATLDDLDVLVRVFRRHDLRVLPQFRLLWQPSASAASPQTGSKSRAMRFASMDDPSFAKFDLPISRYMVHLRSVLGKEKDFPITNKAEARKFIKWSLWDAGLNTAEQQVPLTDGLRRFVVESSKSYGPLTFPRQGNVAHALGRDDKPFPLSGDLVALWRADRGLSKRYDIENGLDRIAFALEVLLRLPEGMDPFAILGAPVCNWFWKPIGGNGLCLKRIEYLMALFARFDLEGVEAAERPWEADAIRKWVEGPVTDVFPAIRALAGAKPKRISARHDIRIAGLPRSQTGIGSNLRMSFDAMRKIGLSPITHDKAKNLRTMELSPGFTAKRNLSRSVNLLHLNADLVPQVLVAPQFARASEAYNIGFLLWEFDVLPRTHQLAMEMLDEVWVPSEFLRETYAKATKKPVVKVLKGIGVPRVPPIDLARFGVMGEAFTFLTCFDFHSSVARKNPLAAVRAFQDAFPAARHPDVRLIIKTTPIETRHWGDPERQMDQIQKAVALDPRMTLITEHLPFNQLLGLIAACDCLLSPHRAEGFGLMPAYALAYDRPVIATDYSGTTDFITEDTATPLSYKLTDVDKSQVLHPMDGARWAEVDHDHFVSAMRDMYRQPGPARKRALYGAKLIKTDYHPDAQAKRYETRLKEIGALH